MTDDTTEYSNAGDSTREYQLSDLCDPDIRNVFDAADWNDLYRKAHELNEHGVQGYLIHKLDSGQYFGQKHTENEGRCWVDVTKAFLEYRATEVPKTMFSDNTQHAYNIVNEVVEDSPKDVVSDIPADSWFINNRKSFTVAKYALADVIEALSNDHDNHVEIAVTKEDGNLVVMFARKPRSNNVLCDAEGGTPTCQ